MSADAPRRYRRIKMPWTEMLYMIAKRITTKVEFADAIARYRAGPCAKSAHRVMSAIAQADDATQPVLYHKYTQNVHTRFCLDVLPFSYLLPASAWLPYVKDCITYGLFPRHIDMFMGCDRNSLGTRMSVLRLGVFTYPYRQGTEEDCAAPLGVLTDLYTNAVPFIASSIAPTPEEIEDTPLFSLLDAFVSELIVEDKFTEELADEVRGLVPAAYRAYITQFERIVCGDFAGAHAAVDRAKPFDACLVCCMIDRAGAFAYFIEERRIRASMLMTLLLTTVTGTLGEKGAILAEHFVQSECRAQFLAMLWNYVQQNTSDDIESMREVVRRVLAVRGPHRVVFSDTDHFPYWVFKLYEPLKLRMYASRCSEYAGNECTICSDPIAGAEGFGWKCPYCVMVTHTSCMHEWMCSSGMRTCPHCQSVVWD